MEPSRNVHEGRPSGPCNWGVFGAEDELGTLNYLTPEAVRSGAASVRTGERYPLQIPLDLPSRKGGGLRPSYQRVAFRKNEELMGMICNDDSVVMALQGSTQWDSLIHAGVAEDGVDGVFYNGVGTDAVDEDGYAHRNGIDKVARIGIAGRGILVDVARTVMGNSTDVLPREFRIDTGVLTETIEDQDVTIEPGDIVCIRTGWTESYLDADDAGRLAIIEDADGRLVSPGITPEVAALAQAQQWAAVVGDNPAVEATPMPHLGSAHVTMLRNLGLLFGELFLFRDLALAAAGDERWDFFFVAAPLWVPGGMGSPGCAMGIR